MASVQSEINALVKEAERQGCSVKFSGSGHRRVTGPNGETITVASTPRTCYAIQSIRRVAKRYLGIEL